MSSKNLTIRYTYNGSLPQDLSSTFFAITQIPHVRCFPAGKYVVVGLSDDHYLQQHTTREITSALAARGFILVESNEARSARTLIAFRPHKAVFDQSTEEIQAEMETRNEVTIDEIVKLNSRPPALKIRLSNQTDATKLLKQGIKAFSIIIPSYQLEQEKYLPVNQCLKCYKFNHTTQNCPSKTLICSKCSEEGHTYKNCNSHNIKCINCSGPHVAVAFKCQHKKQAQKDQNSNNTNPTQNPAQTVNQASYAGASAPPTATTKASSNSNSNNSNTPTTHPNEAFLSTCKIQACAAAAAELSKKNPKIFAKLFPRLLEANNLPTITIPPEIVDLTNTSSTPETSLPEINLPNLPPPPFSSKTLAAPLPNQNSNQVTVSTYKGTEPPKTPKKTTKPAENSSETPQQLPTTVTATTTQTTLMETYSDSDSSLQDSPPSQMTNKENTTTAQTSPTTVNVSPTHTTETFSPISSKHTSPSSSISDITDHNSNDSSPVSSPNSTPVANGTRSRRPAIP